MLLSGGRQYVYGAASNATLRVGALGDEAEQQIFSGGTAIGTTVSSFCVLILDGGAVASGFTVSLAGYLQIENSYVLNGYAMSPFTFFGRRPSVRAARSVMGRHPKTFK
jgi:hypothetical protein